jgi:hypothetical protein
MSYNFKVLGGTTPKSGKSLCLSCAHVARRLGQNMEEEIHCGSYSFDNHSRTLVPFRVSECSDYRSFNSPSREDMDKLAWIVQVRTRGAVGFQAGRTELEIVPPKREDRE